MTLIEIKNFGPIKEIGFDLSKDLIMVYGKNNIGKSYAISVIYLLLKQLKDIDRSLLKELSLSDDFIKLYKAIEKQIHEKKECDITSDINNII